MEPQTLLELLAKCESTASGRGASYYDEACARRAALNQQFERESSHQARTGTAFHKIAELYRTGQLKNYALPIDDLANCDTDHAQEALRLFVAYASFFPADEWTTVAAERLLPQNNEQAARMKDAIGVHFTMRSDSLIHFDQSQADAFFERRFLAVQPGHYLHDYKTHGQKDAKASLKYGASVQFISNMMGHMAAFPDEPINGMIVDEIIRHKRLTRDSFLTYVIPVPSEVQQQSIRKYFEFKEWYLTTNQPNLGACWDWGGCSHYMNGRCDRV